VLYLLYTGMRYVDLPRELGFPSGETVRRRLHEWIERGVWAQALALLVGELDGEGRLDWSRVIVDASIVDAKKGAI
jgi:transposase